MRQEEPQRRITRRDFLWRAAAGAAAGAGALSGLRVALPSAAAEKRAPAGIRRRTLGRTKLKVSELGFGCIRTQNPAVIHRGMDLGINYFDTAPSYRRGNSEIDLGKALKGRREQAIVATKWSTDGTTPAAALLESLDASLNRLEMDYVDLIQIHGADREAQVNSDEVWEAFTRAREAGKVRFNGLTTHSNEVAVIRAAIESGRYDAVLPVHNALTGDTVGPAIQEAQEAGLGVIVMKALAPVHQGSGAEAFAGLPGSPYQQAIRWVLKDPAVSTVIVDMPTFDELEEDVAAVTTPASRAEQAAFERGVAAMALGSCHLCGACTGQCPRGVPVAEIMRYMLYHDGYRDAARATALYRSLPSGAASGCESCPECRVVCPWGVSVRSRMERAHAVLA